MQEAYQIIRVPSYKPWRGFSITYTTNKEIFDVFNDKENEPFLPNMSVSDIPEHLRHLAIENYTYDAEGNSIPYQLNGTENWDDMTVVIDGEEVELEAYMSSLLYNLDSMAPTYPLIVLDSVTVYDE